MKSKKRNIVEKITNCILNILLVLFGIILLISIYTSVQTKVLHNKYVDFFGYSMFEVQTGSMSGTIEAGDWIIVKLTNKVKLNDIVTYKLDKNFITHRIIEVYKDTYVTKGDANNNKDEAIKKDQVIGKVVKSLGSIAIFRKIIFNPSVLVTLIITLVLFNLAFKKIKNKDASDKNKFLKIKNIFEKIIKKLKIFKKGIKINQLNDSNDELAKEYLEQYLKENFKQDDNKKYTEEELEKTSLFRVVSVDASEVDNKYKTTVEEPIEVKPIQKTIEDSENLEMESKNNSLTNVNLDLLKIKKNRKNKNVIETVIQIKKEELFEFIDILNEESKIQPNEKGIKNSFVDAYIDLKYYNWYDGKTINEKRTISLIKKVFKNVANNLIKNNISKNIKFNDLVVKYANILLLCASLDISNIDEEEFKKTLIKYYENSNINLNIIINKIIKIKNKYKEILEFFLKELDTNMFDLNIKKIVSKKNMFCAELKHNIPFSKVYSDYIIDKTYSEGIIAEDKILILFTLLLKQLVNDMLNSNFNNKYVIYLPGSLYEKEKKFEKIIKTIDDKYARSNIVILLTYEDLITNKEEIKKYRKLGFVFGLIIDKKINLKIKEKSNLYIVDYIFINRELKSNNKINSFIPEELSNNIVYEDTENIIGFGSE